MAGLGILEMTLMAVYASQEGIAVDVSTEIVVEPLGPAPRGVEGAHVAYGVELPLGSVVPAEAQLLEALVLAWDLLPEPTGYFSDGNSMAVFTKIY